MADFVLTGYQERNVKQELPVIVKEWCGKIHVELNGQPPSAVVNESENERQPLSEFKKQEVAYYVPTSLFVLHLTIILFQW